MSVCLSVCLSVSLCVYPSVRLSVYVSVHLSACPSVSLSVCESVYVSVHLSVCLSVCLFVCPSVCLFVCLSICLSISLSMWLSVCPSVCPLQLIVESLQKNHNNLTVLAYLDDLFVVGKFARMQPFISDLQSSLKDVGLIVNEKKCELFNTSDSVQSSCGLRWHRDSRDSHRLPPVCAN